MPIENRDVVGFDEISFYAYGEVTVEQGEKESLIIEADKTLLKRIDTRVTDGALIIRLNVDWLESISHILMSGFSGIPIRYVITVKDLKAFRLFGAASISIPALRVEKFKLLLGGAGSISIGALTGDFFKLKLKGAGSVSVAGNVLEQDISVSGAGSFDGRNLKSEKAIVELKGAGSVDVNAQDELDVSLKGLGSVTYYGDPELKKNVRGLGEINSGGAA